MAITITTKRIPHRPMMSSSITILLLGLSVGLPLLSTFDTLTLLTMLSFLTTYTTLLFFTLYQAGDEQLYNDPASGAERLRQPPHHHLPLHVWSPWHPQPSGVTIQCFPSPALSSLFSPARRSQRRRTRHIACM